MSKTLKSLSFLLMAIMLILLMAACGGSTTETASDEPSVRFRSPRDGETVSSPVQFRMSASNYTIEAAGEVNANAGHFHILINHDCVAAGEIIPGDEGYNHYGKAQLDAELELEPGEYTACLQVGDGLHAATELVDTITFTVE